MSDSGKLSPEAQAELNRVVEKYADVIKDDRKPWEPRPEIKFPPAQFSQEWWDALPPEQAEELRRRIVEGMGRMSLAVQEITRVLTQLAPSFFSTLTAAFKPVMQMMKNIENDPEWKAMSPGERAATELDSETESDLYSYVCPYCPNSRRVRKGYQSVHDKVMGHGANP